MLRPCLPCLLSLTLAAASFTGRALAQADEETLRKSVTLYASFDQAVKADFGGGDLAVWTGVRPEPGKPIVPSKGFDAKVFRIVKTGIAGGCLEAVDVLPNNGRILFPAKGNIAFKKGGWGGAVSMWINFDPDKMLKTTFCDPVQITQKGAGNGGIWFDFNNDKPRTMRHGAFTAVKEGEKGIQESDPNAPMVKVPKVGFKSGDWHHIVLSWRNFDTGKADAVSRFWVDGKLQGEIKDRAIAMDWEIDKAGIYFAVNYIGLLDEMAVFNRPLTADEIVLLQKQPGLLQPLRKAAAEDRIRWFAEQFAGAAQVDAHTELRRKLSEYLERDASRPVRELGLHLLLQQPPRGRAGEPPAAPRFPFDAASARQYQEDYAKWLGVPVEFTNDLGMTFRLIPPGKFLMGAPDEEQGRSKEYDDSPRHEVTLTRPIYLCKHETTVAQFRRFVEETKYVTDVEKKGGGNAHDEKAVWAHRPGTQWRKPGYAGPFTLTDRHPIVHVSWTDARNFCQWLNDSFSRDPKGSTLHYDLPTEAQWEWACRAGAGTRYWWGPDEDTTGKVINCGDQTLKKVHPLWPRSIMPMDDGHAFCAPVGTYLPNGFGLHDMLGNVWEFCSDRYRAFTKEPATDPVGTDTNRGYAVRGGGWSNVASDCRCASRNADPPHFGHSNLGFRAALVLPARP